jgi:hypothetical protein
LSNVEGAQNAGTMTHHEGHENHEGKRKMKSPSFPNFVFFMCSFENGIKEGSLTEFTLSIFLEGFEMTRIVILNECEESFPSIFILCGRVQLMIHFVVNTSLLNFAPLRFRGRYCEFGCFAAATHVRDLLVERVFD